MWIPETKEILRSIFHFTSILLHISDINFNCYCNKKKYKHKKENKNLKNGSSRKLYFYRLLFHPTPDATTYVFALIHPHDDTHSLFLREWFFFPYTTHLSIQPLKRLKFLCKISQHLLDNIIFISLRPLTTDRKSKSSVYWTTEPVFYIYFFIHLIPQRRNNNKIWLQAYDAFLR